MNDQQVAQRILDHIARGTTDLGDEVWREPVENYRSPARFAAEINTVFHRTPTPFCPSAALPEPGAYLAREAAGTPLLAVRSSDGTVRAFRNACRHRGMPLAEGSGCAKAFVCTYHGWSYALDGTLQGIPHQHGFPGLNKAMHLFPNVLVTVLSRHTVVVILEPLTVDRTKLVSYLLTNRGSSAPEMREVVERDITFVDQSGAAEDRAVVAAIQRSINSRANTVFTFGRFERAIAHFHRSLDAALEQTELSPGGKTA
jgi:nitrite reductase/ring-hydroxylating ferredoxin subunit